jgi:hypothetical protein
MNEFVFYTVVPALFFIVLLFGAVSILSVILSALSDGKRAGDIFDNVFFASFIGLCSTGIILMLTMSISGLIMLCNS